VDGRGLGKGIWYESVVERVMSALKMESLDVARIPIVLAKVMSGSSLLCNKRPDFNADKKHLTLPTHFITILRYGTPR